MIKEFLKPNNSKEAVLLKKAHKGSFYIGGGTWINSSYSRLNPETVISLAGLNLSNVAEKNGVLEIGSLVTMQAVIDNQKIPEVLREAARHVGSRNIRNMATLGGSIGSGSPWFSLTPALLVLDAVLIIHDGEAEKEIALADYIEKASNELILAIKISLKPKRYAKILKYTRTARTVPVIVAAASCEKDGNKIVNPLLAIGGVAGRVVVLKDLGKQLDNQNMPKRENLEKAISEAVNPKGDFRGSAELRKYMAGVLAADSLCLAFEGAK